MTFESVNTERGFTLVEVTIILLVLVILSSIMLPQLGNFNRLARYVKVKEDLGALCATMKKFLDEVQAIGPFGAPGNPISTQIPIGLLYGPGAVPPDGVNSSFPFGAWDATSTFDEIPDVILDASFPFPMQLHFAVDELEHHLQQNNPLGANSANPADHYRNAVEDFAGVGAIFGWRGPYFDQLTPDPWGNRYMINSFALHVGWKGESFSSAVACFSAGPNGQAETGFNQAYDPAGGNFGWTTGGDDEAVVLSAWGPF